MSVDRVSRANIEPPPVRDISTQAIMQWLTRGWQDMRQAGWPSLLHGLIVAVFSLIIVEIAMFYWPLLPGSVSGFVLIGPFLATGLYALSRKIQQGEEPTIKDSLCAWRQGSRCLFVFSSLLVLAAIAWVVFSMLMFHFFIDMSFADPLDFLRYVLGQDDVIFMLWTILGGLGAALAFAFTVVAMPMLVERDVNTKLAMLTSIRAVGQNPIPMVIWAMTIMFIVGLSFVTLMLGFIVLYPLLGHASWHVYKDLVDTSGLPLRPAA